MFGRSLLLFTLLFPVTAGAEMPIVVASIPPVAALVLKILGPHGEVNNLLARNARPHEAGLRPSQLRALRRADLVVQVGARLEPWLDRAKASSGSSWLVLSEAPGTLVLPARDNGVFGAGSAASGIDPHMWLDPRNAAIWLTVIATELTRRDPDGAQGYADRLEAALAELASVEAEIAGRMAALGGVSIVYAHDAFQYYERRFGLNAVGSLSGVNAESPGAATVAALAGLGDAQKVCVVHDATEGNALARGLFTQATQVTADPMGRDIALDADWLAGFYRDLAVAFEGCGE